MTSTVSTPRPGSILGTRVLRTEDRKIFVDIRLSDGETLLADGEGLFVMLKEGQP